MSQFDESKIKRGDDGKFAEKPPAPEAEDIELDDDDGEIGDPVVRQRLWDRMEDYYGVDQDEVDQRSAEVVSYAFRNKYPDARYLVARDYGEGLAVDEVYRRDGTEIEGACDGEFSYTDAYQDAQIACTNISHVRPEWEATVTDTRGRGQSAIDLDKVDREAANRESRPDLGRSQMALDSAQRDLRKAQKAVDRASMAHLAGQLRTFNPQAHYVEYDCTDSTARLTAVTREDGSEIEMDFEPNAPGTSPDVSNLPENRAWSRDADGSRRARVAIRDML